MTQRRSPSRGSRQQQSQPNRKIGLMVVGGVFAVALIALIVATISSGGGDDDGVAQTADVTVSGANLPLFTQSAGDPALGAALPEVNGVDFAGNAVTITNDGRPKVLLFLAHW